MDVLTRGVRKIRRPESWKRLRRPTYSAHADIRRSISTLSRPGPAGGAAAAFGGGPYCRGGGGAYQMQARVADWDASALKRYVSGTTKNLAEAAARRGARAGLVGGRDGFSCGRVSDVRGLTRLTEDLRHVVWVCGEKLGRGGPLDQPGPALWNSWPGPRPGAGRGWTGKGVGTLRYTCRRCRWGSTRYG